MSTIYYVDWAVGDDINAGTAKGSGNAKKTLAGALAVAVGGDTIYVNSSHAESQASSMTLTSAGTLGSPVMILAADFSGSTPPVAADLVTSGPTVSTTGSSAITFGGTAYCRGIKFQVAATGGNVSSSIASSGSNHSWVMDNCGMSLGGTLSGSITLGGSAAANRWSLSNHTFKFATTGSTIVAKGAVSIKGGSLDGLGAIPTTLFVPSNGTGISLHVMGMDLHAMGAGKTICAAPAAPQDIYFEDCYVALSSGVALGTTPTVPGATVRFRRCSDDATNYKNKVYSYYGTYESEATVVRTGGASDGTTTLSHKITPTANAKYINPFKTSPEDSIEFWNETVGSQITVTVQCTWGGGAVPTNEDIFMDAEYLGDASKPIMSVISTGKANTLSANNGGYAAGSGTWGGGTTKFAMQLQFTPRLKGPVRLRIGAISAGPFYIDPKPIVT